MDHSSMNALLGELNQLSAAVRSELPRLSNLEVGEADPDRAETSFGALMQDLLSGVNDRQRQANDLAQAFERGEGDLAAVMIAKSKAKLAFQSVLQTRNQLLSAYRDIMNMPL